MFVLTKNTCWTLWGFCQFRLPTDRWVFFGLRGCLPVRDKTSFRTLARRFVLDAVSRGVISDRRGSFVA